MFSQHVSTEMLQRVSTGRTSSVSTYQPDASLANSVTGNGRYYGYGRR